MTNYIPSVWGWYLKRSPWIKWALFIFVGIVIVLLAIVYLILPNKKGMTVFEDGDTTVRVREFEKQHEEDLKATTKLDSQLAHQILEQEERRKELDEQEQRIAREAEEAFAQIDGSDSFDDVDRAIDRYIRRRSKPPRGDGS